MHCGIADLMIETPVYEVSWYIFIIGSIFKERLLSIGDRIFIDIYSLDTGIIFALWLNFTLQYDIYVKKLIVAYAVLRHTQTHIHIKEEGNNAKKSVVLNEDDDEKKNIHN